MDRGRSRTLNPEPGPCLRKISLLLRVVADRADQVVFPSLALRLELSRLRIIRAGCITQENGLPRRREWATGRVRGARAVATVHGGSVRGHPAGRSGRQRLIVAGAAL